MTTPNGGSNEPCKIIVRRAFKKSRRGCRTCKARKVKCDEKHPLCGNCRRRFVGIDSCDFEDFILSSTAANVVAKHSRGETQQSAIQPQITISPRNGVQSSESRVLELRLMHHYSTFTCNELPKAHSSQGKQVWSINIPRLSFYSDDALNALLAISALHLFALCHEDASLAYRAKLYFDRAVKQHRVALSKANCDNAESLLATAILITHYTWLAAHTHVGDQPYEIPVQTYHMARKIKSLIEYLWPLFKDSGYLWYVEQDQEEEPDTEVGHPFLSSVQEDLARLSESFNDQNTSITDRMVYMHAIQELSSLSKAIVSSKYVQRTQNRLATMPLRLPPRFLELVEQKDPRSLVLIARNIALLKLIDDVWWLHGIGQSQRVAEYSINGIKAMVASEWMWAMDWPLSLICHKNKA
ncbi:hypothetical protein B0O99DRAFT_687902 [Bisporella sp. PMI_857]|nr:hypothetical protein B0O99DRAFT_687902 [Bisporella sp. PMI_857]